MGIADVVDADVPLPSGSTGKRSRSPLADASTAKTTTRAATPRRPRRPLNADGPIVEKLTAVQEQLDRLRDGLRRLIEDQRAGGVLDDAARFEDRRSPLERAAAPAQAVREHAGSR